MPFHYVVNFSAIIMCIMSYDAKITHVRGIFALILKNINKKSA